MTDETPDQRLKRVMLTQSLNEDEARFVIAMADKEIDGDVIDPDREKVTLGDVVRAEQKN